MHSAWLDHVSLTGEWSQFESLGFRVTVTNGAPHHGRIFLDRAYLEVTSPRRTHQKLKSRVWFLRPDNPAAAADSLSAAGFEVEGPEPYRGEDGDWLDVVARDPSTTALPILTRRVDRRADEWPPPLEGEHPNGACRLAGLRLRLRDPRTAGRLLQVVGIRENHLGAFLLPGDARVEIEASAEAPEGVVAVIVERRDGSALELAVEPDEF